MKYSRLYLLLLVFISCSPHTTPGQNNRTERFVKKEIRILKRDLKKKLNSHDRLQKKIRAVMNDLIVDLGFTRSFIFGPQDKYFKKGMYAHFKSPPEKMKGHFNRNPKVIELENKHVELYHADYNIHVWEKFRIIISSLELSQLKFEKEDDPSREEVRSLIIANSMQQIEDEFPHAHAQAELFLKCPYKR